MKVLSDSIELSVRFSEVDSMAIVWHGHYCQYLEEAREQFGRSHKLGYLQINELGYQIPLVELNIQYKQKLIYGDQVQVEISYEYADAAKIIFNYRIYRNRDRVLAATARTVQVFIDRQGVLQLLKPDFFLKWQKTNGLG